ncbi:hypothetical protein TIFTF001_032228 [Ficus carica]|uniref:Uncharacterized protein n=1 Tax=Ficus carica TaxID=3494 RepID=A0AA88DY37_FICCA|nr:hypothetical protein TIFTF001_032228 [Ficus carica]
MCSFSTEGTRVEVGFLDRDQGRVWEPRSGSGLGFEIWNREWSRGWDSRWGSGSGLGLDFKTRVEVGVGIEVGFRNCGWGRSRVSRQRSGLGFRMWVWD